jgi:hypothetical protein
MIGITNFKILTNKKVSDIIDTKNKGIGLWVSVAIRECVCALPNCSVNFIPIQYLERPSIYKSAPSTRNS